MGSNEVYIMSETYFGTKMIKAMPVTLGEYNAYRGWDMPADEDPETAGYLVEYPYDEQTVPNHEAHVGYISWSPAHVFDAAYQPQDALSFGHALEAMKAGLRVCRAGWNGKGMWVASVPKHTNGHGQVINPAFRIKQVNGDFSSWVPSTGDCHADDWQIVEGDA